MPTTDSASTASSADPLGDEIATLCAHINGTTAHVEKLVRDTRRVDGSKDAQAARAERRRLYLCPAEDGGYEIRGRLSPEVGGLLLGALEVAERKLFREQRQAGTEHKITAAQRRADALGLWLEEQVQPEVQLVVHSFEGGEPETRVTVAGGVPAGLVTEEGGRVSAETSLRLASDAEVVPIRRGADGSVLDVGRRRRTVDWRLRKALEVRDGGCPATPASALRPGPLARTDGHRGLGRQHRVAWRTHRLGLGAGLVLQPTGREPEGRR